MTILLQGKEPPVPIGYDVGWAPKSVWTLWKKIYILSLLEIELRFLDRDAL
jgi:hypothetical protein